MEIVEAPSLTEDKEQRYILLPAMQVIFISGLWMTEDANQLVMKAAVNGTVLLSDVRSTADGPPPAHFFLLVSGRLSLAQAQGYQ